MMQTVEDLEKVVKENLIKKTKSRSNPEKTLQTKFKGIDTNHDGTISLGEFRKALETFVVGVPDRLVTGLFEKWDTDHSGTLNVDEFVLGFFKTPEELEKMKKEKKQQKEEVQSKSVLSDDIIEQAKARRAARKAELEKERKRLSNPRNQHVGEDERVEKDVQTRLASYTKKKAGGENNPLEQYHEQRTCTGPFRADSTLNDLPDVVRYRVSSTWINTNPPSNWDATKELRNSSLLPSDSLDLEFVYGINYKAGLFVRTESGELVYAAAGVGIVYDPRKHSQRFFKGHDDDITTISLDPSEKFAATGQMGKSPIVHVWDVETMSCVGGTEPGFYDRSIVAVAFVQTNPKLLVAIGGDNHHMMAVWDWTKKRMLAQVACQNGIPPQISAIVFDDTGARAKSTTHRFVTCGFKHTKFWTFDETSDTLVGGKNATYGRVSPTPKETRSAVFLPGNIALTGGSNGVIYIWDLQNNTCRRAIPAHDGPVLGMLVAANQQLITNGAKDSTLAYWSTETVAQGSGGTLTKVDSVEYPKGKGPGYSMGFIGRGKAMPVLVSATHKGSIMALSFPQNKPEWKTLVGGHAGDLYGLATHPIHSTAFCTVGEDQLLNIWDAESKQVVQTIQLPGQARSIDVSKTGRHADEQLIAVGFKDGSFCILETTTFTIISKAKHCQETIDDVKFSPDSTKLAVGSHDNFIDIYDMQSFQHLGRCKGHSSYITHLDWSADGAYIMSNCGAYESLVWDVSSMRVFKNSDVVRDIDWATYTSVLGFDVMGIWPEGADGTDINALSRAPEHDLVVTGDDSGNVNVFNFPCLVKNAPHHVLTGHSSHVMNVRWTVDGARVITVGGADKSVFQWKKVSFASTTQQQQQMKQKATLVQPKRSWKPSTQWK